MTFIKVSVKLTVKLYVHVCRRESKEYIRNRNSQIRSRGEVKGQNIEHNTNHITYKLLN